jgi:uncharacterized protein YndB with AHSA1/START domain
MVGYMSDSVGQTKDAGWEVGVRKTVDRSLDEVWDYLLGDGLPLWLGDIDALPTDKGAAFETRDGVRGRIRSYTANYRVRVSWQPNDWPHDTTLQLTVKEAATGTTIAIHHENLADRDERKLMLGYWKDVVASLATAVTR